MPRIGADPDDRAGATLGHRRAALDVELEAGPPRSPDPAAALPRSPVRAPDVLPALHARSCRPAPELALAIVNLDDLRRLAADGLSDREIGDALGVSGRTVLRWRTRHGIASTWAPTKLHNIAGYNRGCRCADCIQANRAASKKVRLDRARRTAAAPRWREPWTPAEDTVALELSALDAALELGRTWSAVANRRRRLLGGRNY